MASSVSVLAPNGRRQTVKCTANTTVLQIIEEVCRKQGFKPEDYDIKHHNKVLDTTMSFRFSGLPNNAQLELATATKARIDSEITLAVSLEDGARLVGNFLPDETLHKVLSKLCPNEFKPNDNPVVIYMRNEVYGEKLQVTTLKSLGLRGGRAMMRLLHKKPEDLKIQANISAPLQAKPVEEKPETPFHRTLKTDPVPEQSHQNSEPKQSEVKTSQNVDFGNVDSLKLARDREKRKLESPTRVPPEVQSPRTKLKIEQQEEMEVDEVPKKAIATPDEDIVFLGERQALLFSLESARSVPSEDLPDDFFELTIDDAKKILGDIRRRRNEMDNGNLMTSAMRNLEESKKQLRHLHRYKQSVIRVQFPDRTILQGSFRPSETIQDVKDFVTNYLSEGGLEFHLYTTPPKSVLNELDRLVEVGCVPGALLHLGTNSDGNISLKEELRDKFTTNSAASLAASRLRKEGLRGEDTSKAEEDEGCMEVAEDVNTAGPSAEPTSYERKIVRSTENVPKWFKPSK